MIRLIRLLIDDPQILGSLLSYLPTLLVLVFTVYVAIYAQKRIKTQETSYMMIGAILQIISTLAHIVFNSIILPNMMDVDYSNITYYYIGMNLIGTIGGFLFLYGVYKLIKNLLENKNIENSDPKLDVNSFIQRN